MAYSSKDTENYEHQAGNINSKITSISVEDIDETTPIQVGNNYTIENVFGGLNKIIKAIVNNVKSNSDELAELTKKINRIGKIAVGKWERTGVDWEQGDTYHDEIELDYYVSQGTLSVKCTVTDTRRETFHDVLEKEEQVVRYDSTLVLSPSGTNTTSLTRTILGGIATTHYLSQSDYRRQGCAQCTISLINNPSLLQSKLVIDIVVISPSGTNSYYKTDNFRADSLTIGYELY